MRLLLAALAAGATLTACQTAPVDRYDRGPYDPGGYPSQDPYPYPPQPYPPQPYPPQPGGPAYPLPPAPPYPPQGQVAPMLSGTNWTVVAINGQPTPQRDFYLNFMPDRLAAKFGCNSLGAGYRMDGGMLVAGAVMATRMACPDMRFEDQGTRILMQPMQARVMESYPERLVLSNAAGRIEAVRAR